MCGIYGALGSGLGARELAGAARTLAHRGPDGGGERLDPRGGAYLAHARLAIIDLSEGGAQPMPNEDGTLQLVLNGEIYNHAELRRELEAKGHRFRGRCDAEVVLHLYEEQGLDCLARLRGMFAFALHDERTGELVLARDRLGIKPLVYYDDGRRFAFASELKALRATPGLDLEPDPTAWYDFLTYQFVPAPKTLWKRARKLPAGHWLRRDGGGRVEVRRWWSPPFEPEGSMGEGEALERLDAALSEAVRDHLVADVPVGVFLSGGTDSSLVAAYAAEASPEALQAFCIRFPERGDDEAVAASEIARRLGLRFHVEDFDRASLGELAPWLPALFDEPFADLAALPMLPLSRLAASQVKVVLSGDGGDETHLGYGRYFKERQRRGRYALADALGGDWLVATPLGRVAALRNAAEGRYGRLCHFYGGIPRRTKLALLEDLHPDLAGYDDYWLFRESDRPDLPPLARLQAIDFAGALPEGYLTKVDRTTMRFGLELRPPLLDHRLVELAGAIPAELKCATGERKHLLKRLLERRLPPELVRRPKRGFSVPIRSFAAAADPFRPAPELDVLGAFSLRRRRVERLLGPARDSHQLWILHVLAQFAAAEAGDSPAAPLPLSPPPASRA